MKVWIGIMTCSALLAGKVRAESFRTAEVSADAAWIVHVDVAALKQTPIGEMILKEMNRTTSEAELNAIQAIFNFDPREDLSGVTLYGAGARPDQSVALLRGRFDPTRLVTLVRANPSYEASQSGSHAIHSWIDQKKPEAKRVYAGFSGEDALAISESRDRAVLALDVLGGDAASLDPAEDVAAAIQGTPASLFMAAANMADMPDVAPEAALLKKARSFQLSLAASGENLEGTLRVNTDSARTAERVEHILKGMMAFAELNDADQPDLAAMARNMDIARDGDGVVCAMRHPLDKVAMFMQHEAERKRAKNGS